MLDQNLQGNYNFEESLASNGIGWNMFEDVMSIDSNLEYFRKS